MDKSMEMAQCAAKWWADKLRSRPMHDNGDPASGPAMVLADMLAMRNVPEAAQIDQFEKVLSEMLHFDIEKGWYHQISIGCDYGPCAVLGNAAEAAGIDSSVFPFKVHMLIAVAEKAVYVQDGYGAPRVQIYPQAQDEGGANG